MMHDLLPCEFCGFPHNHQNAFGAEHIAYTHNALREAHAEIQKLRADKKDGHND